jgi:hypothetical protein
MSALGMSVGIMRGLLCWVLAAGLPLSLLGQVPPQTQPSSAILHAEGGVWVNGAEAHDSTAVFSGDVLQTKPGFSATLSLDGTEVLLAPETVGKFDGDAFVLDHGSVSVGTSKSFKVKVNCIKVVPVHEEWTKYEVTDTNGTVQVSALKNDVNVEHAVHAKPSAENTASSDEGSVHEGQQKNYDETELCGAPPRPASAGSGVNPKWIAAGAGGAGILILILLHGNGGGKSPISASAP